MILNALKRRKLAIDLYKRVDLKKIKSNECQWQGAPCGISKQFLSTTTPAQGPFPEWQEIRSQWQSYRTGVVKLPKESHEHLNKLLNSFKFSKAAQTHALDLYVNATLFKQASTDFSKALLLACSANHPHQQRALALRSNLTQIHPNKSDDLFPLFAQFVIENYGDKLKDYRELVQGLDLRAPHKWFPVARALQRKIVYHSGPTNSGKTHQALEAMTKAPNGIYCGPLRLLAMEVYERLNADGTYCNLITGQERRLIPSAEHTACTVEMISLQKRVEVAVIDEIQLLSDSGRGWAWTRALMGIPASEIHVCGDGSVVDIVKSFCSEVGDDFELREYDRFTPLRLTRKGLKEGYSSVKPGDCIVAFSRKDIYDIKTHVEATTPHKACVIYGALPPETRRMQARLFNEKDNEYSVMVASDAVGMGLNLNIGRIIFHSLKKFEKDQKSGKLKKVPVSTSAIKQIAGRAGRRSSAFAAAGGIATCRSPGEVSRLKEALDLPLSALAKSEAGIFPEFEHLEIFAARHPQDKRFKDLLTDFIKNALVGSGFFLCKQESVLWAAQLLSGLKLSLKDNYNFCTAPANSRDPFVGGALLHFATRYASGIPSPLSINLPKKTTPQNLEELKCLESAHQVATLWLWLSYRFEENFFPGREHAEATADALCALLDEGLKEVTQLSKRRKNVAEGEARVEILTILDAYQAEVALLQERYQKEMAELKEMRKSKKKKIRSTEDGEKSNKHEKDDANNELAAVV